jgi:hypothetical protein
MARRPGSPRPQCPCTFSSTPSDEPREKNVETSCCGLHSPDAGIRLGHLFDVLEFDGRTTLVHDSACHQQDTCETRQDTIITPEAHTTVGER